jgi:uncharacterized membrane protein YoaK (UPF0700 family)
MAYALAADLIAVAHLAFLAFVVFGALLGRRNRWWRVTHLAAVLYGVLIEVFYWYCPLTYLEQFLRKQAGQESYAEPFIAHYLNRIMYVDIPQWALILAAIVVFGINFGIYLFPCGRAKPYHH